MKIPISLTSKLSSISRVHACYVSNSQHDSSSWPPAVLQDMLFYTSANLSFPLCSTWLSFGPWLLGKASTGRAAFWAAHPASRASFSSAIPVCQTTSLPHSVSLWHGFSQAQWWSSSFLGDMSVEPRKIIAGIQLYSSCTWNIASNIQNHDFYHAKPTPYSTQKIRNIPAILHAPSEKYILSWGDPPLKWVHKTLSLPFLP